MYQKKSDSKSFFKTLGVGDLQVPSVSDFAGESPLRPPEDGQGQSTMYCLTNLRNIDSLKCGTSLVKPWVNRWDKVVSKGDQVDSESNGPSGEVKMLVDCLTKGSAPSK